MATTTNYGWTTPDDTSLVKDGASAIRTLGSAIDTSLNTALGTKKAGLVLLNTTTFSAVASQSINDVFSATYTNYLAIITNTANTSTDPMYMRLRVSGADNTTSNYNYAGDNTPGGYDQWTQATYGTTAFVWHRYGTGGQSANMNFYSPFATNNTGVNSISNNFGSNARKNTFGGYFDATTSFTGFTIYPGSGNITGTVRVYGYNQ